MLIQKPLVIPINSPELVAKFPPTLLIASTRTMEFGATVNSHNVLVKKGVHAVMFGMHFPMRSDTIQIYLNQEKYMM